MEKMKCFFKNSYCQTCGKSESAAIQICFYNDPFWFPEIVFFNAKRSSKETLVKLGTKREYVYRRDGYSCVYCGSLENLTLDHVFPLSKGGNSDVDNLQTLCRRCNLTKGSLTEEVFFKSDKSKFIRDRIKRFLQ